MILSKVYLFKFNMIAYEAKITSIDRPKNMDGLFDEIYDYQLFYLLSSNIKENRVGGAL